MKNSNINPITNNVSLVLFALTIAMVVGACDDDANRSLVVPQPDDMSQPIVAPQPDEAPKLFDAPALAINIAADDIPNSNKLDATMDIYNCHNRYATCNSTAMLTTTLPVGIERRGQSSQSWDKKNYGIEIRNIHGFDRDYPMLGMPAESDWILYAGGYDPSMLANSVTFEIYRSIFSRWAPRTEYVNLYLQDEYRGLYSLMERIKIGTDRVDIRKVSPNDRFGTAVTGGYILRFERASQIETAITTDEGTIFEVHTPNSDDIVPEQIEYLQRYLNDVETAIVDATTLEELAQWVDIDSLVDHILIHELSYNRDSYVFSTYFYKQHNDQKLYFGPPWDFDLAHGLNGIPARDTQKLIIHNNSKWSLKRINMWRFLWKHEFVREAVAARWRELRQNETITIDILHEYIDEQVELMMGMQYSDFAYWGRSNGHWFLRGFKPQSHPHMIIYMKDFLAGQVAWLDECFSMENKRNYCS